MAMLIAPVLKLDQLKLIKMALIHDLGEAQIGDIIWERGVKTVGSQHEKHTDENKAISQIFADSSFAEYVELWLEFEKQKSKEAKVLKLIDKLEMAFQAYEYELAGNDPHKLEEFWKNAEKYLLDSELESIFRKVVELKSKTQHTKKDEGFSS